MADKDIPGLNRQLSYFTPHGNLSMLPPMTVSVGTGAGERRTAADREFVAKLPRGILITDVTMVVRNGTGNTDNVDIGTVQKGEGSWTDDPDHFLNNAGVNAVDTLSSRNDGARPKPLFINEEGVFLVLTWNTEIAANETVDIDFYVEYLAVGNE